MSYDTNLYTKTVPAKNRGYFCQAAKKHTESYSVCTESDVLFTTYYKALINHFVYQEKMLPSPSERDFQKRINHLQYAKLSIN